ncbi:MAG: gliding motility protein GldN [Bacteroidota bacterium]
MKRIVFIAFVAILVTGVRMTSVAQVLEAPPRDGVYDRTVITQVQPIPYPYLREADITWTKRIWRVIDMREKMNQPFYFPESPQNQWKSFMQILLDAMKEGTIQAYSAETDLFLVPVTYKEMMDQLESKQKVRLKRPENPDEEYDTVISKPFYASDVKQLRIKEDWYFDKQRSVLEVRILGVCPMMESFTDDGTSRGYKPLFWIYFPDCRNLFARSEQFNLRNGVAGRLTYDDVFMKRIFSSYIYKEENVYDRKITDYATGVDALLESERTKNKILEFESSLWEY